MNQIEKEIIKSTCIRCIYARDSLNKNIQDMMNLLFNKSTRDRSDLTGKTFGKLTIIGPGKDRTQKSGRVRKMWTCKCECGKTIEVYRSNLTTHNTTSCGCIKKMFPKGSNVTNIPGYKSWDNMIQRCTNPNADNYHLYGGRGIEVCKEWQGSFKKFYEDMGERPSGMTLERIDPDGNYEPSNCKWATWSEQRGNRRPKF